jgi:heme exporter protein D
MNWANSEAFWAMGGYGLYVWGSFGVVAIGLAAEVLMARRASRQIWRNLRDEVSDNQAP